MRLTYTSEQAKQLYTQGIFIYKGASGTIQSLCKQFDIRLTDLYVGAKTKRPLKRYARECTVRRIQMGWPIEDILTMPHTYPQLEDEVVTFNGQCDEARLIETPYYIPLSVIISRMVWELPLSQVFAP